MSTSRCLTRARSFLTTSTDLRQVGAGVLCRLPLACVLGFPLAAQALPTVPRESAELPSLAPSDLVPLRPYFGTASSHTPPRVLHWRGERVRESPQAWVLEGGALEGEGFLLLADLITYEPETGHLRAQGRIRFEAPGVRLRCERLEMDWNQLKGEAWSLELEVPPSWTLRSDRVAFQTFRRWSFDRVTVSPCPEQKPGWSAQLSSLKLDLDGFATLWNALLKVGPVPALYLPWAAYPAKPERSSGLLPPILGASSTMGFSLGVPYYQVLGPSADAAFSPEFYSKEGTMWAGELRWAPDPTHNGSFRGQYIQQHSNGERRYRYSLKELWQREDGWQFTSDINQASDSLIDADYGRGVANLGGTSFDSAIYLGRAFKRFSFSLESSEQQSFFLQNDPFYRAGFPASLRRQAIPQLQARLYPISFGGLYLDGGLRMSRLAYRFDLGESSTASEPGSQDFGWGRSDAQVRLHGRLGQWGPLRADLEMAGRYTYYGASLRSGIFDPTAVSTDPAFDPFRVDGSALHRRLASGRLQISSPPVGRLFESLNFLGYRGELKHVAEPFVALTGVTRFTNAGITPRFDEVDSRPGVHGSAVGEQSIEIGLKQHLLGRGGKGLPFADLVRWRVSTRYHLQPILLSDGRVQKGWASIDNDLDVEPDDRIRLSFRRSSDVTGTGADSSLSADFKGRDGSRFSLAFFSTGINRLLVRQQGLQVGGMQSFFEDRWRAEFQANYDFRQHTFSTSQVALTRVTPCVAFILRYSHVAIPLPSRLSKEDRIDLTLNLRGLGDLFTIRP